MEYFKLCSEVIKKEREAFNLNSAVIGSHISALTAYSEDFHLEGNRCAYMYKYGTSYICFVQDCILRFLIECSEAKHLLSLWRSCSDLRLCSFSRGPGLDYLSFSLAASELGETSLLFNSIKIITKYASWRNTVKFLSEAIQEAKVASLLPQKINYENVEVIRGDLTNLSTTKIMDAVKNCTIVFMSKTLNLAAADSDQETSVLSTLQVLISLLSSETTLFFIDTKPSASLMLKALSQFPGTFLYGPLHLDYIIPVTFNDDVKKIFGDVDMPPGTRARGTFFVWQKSSHSPLLQNIAQEPCVNVQLQSKECKTENNDISSIQFLHFPLLGTPSDSSTTAKGKVSDTSGCIGSLISSSKESSELLISNATPSHSQVSNTSSDSDFLQGESSSYCSPRSKLSTSISSNDSSFLEPSLSASSKNSTPVRLCTHAPITTEVGIVESFETFSKDLTFTKEINKSIEGDADKSSKFNIPVSESSGIDLKVIAKCYSDVEKNSEKFLEFPKLNIPTCAVDGGVDTGISAQIIESCQSSSKSESSKKQKSQNICHSNDYKTYMDTKLIQTDYPVETESNNNPSSVNSLMDQINQLISSFERGMSLTDEINQLISSFEREMTQQKDPCKSHKANFTDRHSSFHDQQMPCCVSDSPHCEDIGAEDSHSCFDGKSHSELGNIAVSDSKERENVLSYGRGCDTRKDNNQCNSCVAHHCCRSNYIQCCHEQHVPRCHSCVNNLPQGHSSCGFSYVNSPTSVTMPSIVIPLQNISGDILSQILSLSKSA